MKQIKVSEASGAVLIYLVALCEGFKFGAPRKVGGEVHFPLSRPDWDTLGNAPYSKRHGRLANVPDYLGWEDGGPIIGSGTHTQSSTSMKKRKSTVLTTGCTLAPGQPISSPPCAAT